MVMPKRTLTGENSERIDTRVLELIYRFQQENPAVLPGQLLDVYIDSGESEMPAGTLTKPADTGAVTS
jgi:hypothetical protein